jgi:choloylglycine hydrolase
MNEQGLAIGMAAVPQAEITPDPLRPDIYSVEVMREVLDHAGDVEQATSILQRYDILWGSGPPLHYLVADRSGRAALVEFFRGKVVVYDHPPESAASSGADSTTTWHAATNFSLAEAGASTQGQCWRYDHIVQALAASNGKLDAAQAMALLEKVSQQGLTQWSLVYDLSRGQVDVAMGRDYEEVHSFQLPRLDPPK